LAWGEDVSDELEELRQKVATLEAGLEAVFSKLGLYAEWRELMGLKTPIYEPPKPAEAESTDPVELINQTLESWKISDAIRRKTS
jgi:hypothetical protein